MTATTAREPTPPTAPPAQDPVAPSTADGRSRARRHPSAVRRLVTAELRLLRRDPVTLTFVLVFPVVSMLIIGGSFGTEADDAFPVDPTQWYVASYLATVIGSTGLIMLPVHLAAYRERGVLRRLAASGFPRWSFSLAQGVVGLAAIVVGSVALLAVAAPVYGVPEPAAPLRVAAGVVAGAAAFVSLGVLLGTLLPSARAAQAVGLLLFFPSFLLGGGGPPPAVMSPVLADVSRVLPMRLMTDAIREPWLGLGDGTAPLLAVTAMALVLGVLAARRTSL